MKWVERRFPATQEYDGAKLFTRIDGKKLATPMFIVIMALGTTDLLFALDSIPAIYGLTKEPYLVLTANMFALMGLRQLYFLIGGLLKKLVYLSIGLAVCSRSSASSWCCTPCTRTSCRSSTVASTSRRPPTSRSRCRWPRSS